MLVELITRNAADNQEEQGPYFPRPSSVGKCVRALVYHATAVEPDRFPGRTLLVFEDGNTHEKLIKDHIRKTVFRLDELKGAKQRIFIAMIGDKKLDGEIDGLVTDPFEYTRLLEIKSINHFGFERLKDEPLDDHRRQANLYLHGLAKAGLPIVEGIILYKNKNTATMKEFTIRYDEAQALADIAMFENVERMAADGEIPPRPYDFDDWHCGYCRWQEHCWSNYVAEVKALSENVALAEELETTARYYKELGAQETEIGKERDVLKGQLKAALKEANAQSGRAGEYLISISISERKKYIEELVPPDAIEKVPSERFNVKSMAKKGSKS